MRTVGYEASACVREGVISWIARGVIQSFFSVSRTRLHVEFDNSAMNEISPMMMHVADDGCNKVQRKYNIVCP
jgi:hypothetical protein